MIKLICLLLIVLIPACYLHHSTDCPCNQKERVNFSMEDPKFPESEDQSELGQYIWGVLHSRAVEYPDSPSEEDKKNLNEFINKFANMIPIKEQREEFLKLLDKNPIQNENKNDLIYYFCYLHNDINSQLKKPHFDCRKAEMHWGEKKKCDCHEKSSKKEEH